MAYPIRLFTQRIRALVLNRSIELVKNDKVKLLDHDDEHAQFHVENQRGGYYHVEVSKNSQRYIQFQSIVILFSHHTGCGVQKYVKFPK